MLVAHSEGPMRRTWWILISVAIVVGFGLRSGGCASRSRAPDERLAKHFSAICTIADRHVESPHAGAKKLFRYLGDHGPEMLHDWGDLLVLIERIDDDAKHDARARTASHRFDAVLGPCQGPMSEFLSAVEDDPEASALAEHNFKRLDRTLNIIFGGGARLGDLPALLRARLDAALAP
jgi:hypothetical protein